jgi:hypothetical protein
MVITGGEENRSRIWSTKSLQKEINSLQATDKCTFAFRVPRGSRDYLARFGIPVGNIMEWEQNESSMYASTEATVASTQSYFKGRSAGVTSTSTFFVDASNLNTVDVQ